jgi:hypothetical protein
MRAISIRQPWAELILRRRKTIEVRSRPTRIRERVYIYAGQGRSEPEDETQVALKYRIDLDRLPRGVLVGTVEIVGCRPLVRKDSSAAGFKVTGTSGLYAWLLSKPMRAGRLQKPKNHPQPMWFNPFG